VKQRMKLFKHNIVYLTINLNLIKILKQVINFHLINKQINNQIELVIMQNKEFKQEIVTLRFQAHMEKQGIPK
jgi:hypothetical protein